MWINRLTLFMIIIASFIFASFYGGPIPYSLLYFSLSIPLVAVIYVFYVYFHFKIYQHVESKTLVKEEPVTYSFELSNENHITFQNIKLCFFQDKSTVLNQDKIKPYCLLPGDKQSFTSTLICKYRGEYEVGIDCVNITDFFNLFHITYALPSHLKITVLPKIVILKESHIISTDFDSKQGLYRLGADDEERDAETHKYTYGDSPKNIHWKISAKKHELTARSFAPISKRRVRLFLDLESLHEDALLSCKLEDRMIECLLSLAYYCLQKHTPASIYFAENQKIDCLVTHSESTFNELYQKSSVLQFTSSLSLSDLLAASALNPFENNQYILVTHHLSEVLYKSLLPLRQQGNAITILYAEAGFNEDVTSLISLFTEAAIAVIRINHEVSLEGVL